MDSPGGKPHEPPVRFGKSRLGTLAESGKHRQPNDEAVGPAATPPSGLRLRLARLYLSRLPRAGVKR